MTMKNTFTKLRIASVVCLLFVWSGCDNFLEPDPASFSTTANFYETPDQFEQAVNGVYSRFRAFVGDADYRYANDLRGPNLTRHFDVNLPHTVAGVPQLDEFTMDVSNGIVNNNWIRAYQVIKEANVVLNRIEDIEFADTAKKDRIIGEAKVMRAFCYWVGVQWWGDMPLQLTEVSSPNEAVPEGGRTPKAQVLQQVITDLQDAISKLPASYDGANAGRVTKGAAQTLLGKTYMLTGDWTNAISQFEAVDNSGEYMLLADYRQVFNPANKNNPESILELQYDPNIAGQPQVDALFADAIPFNSGSEIAPVSALTPAGRLMPTPDVIDSFEEGDLRYEASIGWWTNNNTEPYPEIAYGNLIPYMNKFVWPDFVNSQGQFNSNFIIFRFADVLLSAAEAHWRNGNNGAAAGYLDRVRSRAGLPAVDLANFDGSVTGSAMGDAILHERDVELLSEGHNWLDLLRFGNDVALRVMQNHGTRFRARDPKTADVYVIQDFKLTYMIPPNEVILGELSQNTGW